MSMQRHITVLAAATLALTACDGNGGGGGGGPAPGGENRVVVGTVAADFSGSDVQIVDVDNDYAVTGSLIPRDRSDYTLDRYGEYFYPIGRFGIDTVSKYHIEDPSNEIYEYSTLDDPEDPSSNPYRLVFASETKAYLIRYGADKIWIVDPSAETEAAFKLGELDLSAYDDGDGTPEATDGVIVDGRLFVTLPRLVDFSPAAEGVAAYVAVFDTETDTEIDTDPADDPTNRKGIELITRHPAGIVYEPDAGLLVQSAGDVYGSFNGRPPGYDGGITRIDLDDYMQRLIVDDGDAADAPYGYLTGLAVVDGGNGYFLGYGGYQNVSLYHFDPATGEVSGAVAGFEGIDITTLEAAPDGTLWVGIGDAANPRIEVLDTDRTPLRTVSLIQNPEVIRFGE